MKPSTFDTLCAKSLSQPRGGGLWQPYVWYKQSEVISARVFEYFWAPLFESDRM